MTSWYSSASRFKKVAGSVVQSSDIMGDALANLSTLTQATDEVLEDLTIRTADASRLWGGDAAKNAKLLGGAMKQWQVPAERGADLIDTLGSVSQQYGVKLDKLLTTTNEYSAVLINAGFRMDESVDLFGRLEGAGISVSRVMPGLNAAFRNWADAGKDSRVELARVVDQIHTTTDAQKALSIATEAFGAEGAQRMVTAIRTGQIPSLSDLAVSLDDVNGTLDTANDGSKTFGERLAQLKNKIGAAVPPSALQAFGSLALAIGALGPLVATVGGLFVKGAANIFKYVTRLKAANIWTAALKIKAIALAVAQRAAAAAQWLVNAAMSANPIGLVIAAIALLVAAWIKWDDEIMAFLRGTWNLVKEGFYAFKRWVGEAFGVLKGWLDKIPTPILALMGPVGLVLATFKHWDDIPKIAKAAYQGIKTWLSDKLGAIFDGIKSKVDWVVDFFGGMKDKIVGNSIVPDMVNLIGSEFDRMGMLMAEKTDSATAAVTASMEGMTGKTEGWMSRFKDTMTGSLKSMLKGITGGEGISGMLTGIGKGVVDGIGNLVSGGLASLANLALKGLVAVGKKLWGTIKGWFSRGKRKREKAAAEEKARIAEVTRVAEEAAAKQAAAAKKAAEEQKRYWDSIYSAAISAYDRSKAAGVAAYDEIFLAAIESGDGQKEAVRKATAAQIEASEEILKAEGDKFARLAAFEAALDAIRSGNAAGAADAAVQAAADTRSAWEIAMGAVTLADQAAGDAMIDTSQKVAAIQEKNAKAAADAQVAAAEAAKDAWTWEPPDSSGDDDIPGGFQDPEGFDGFQHGGPVQAGKPILVGEAGPELFIPSQGGRIDPNVSSAGGGANAKELAAAVSEALQNTRIEVDGRQFGRLSIRHQPIAVAELGGRR